MDRSGAKQLAPAYDLSFSNGPGGEHTLLIGGKGRRPGRVHFDLRRKGRHQAETCGRDNSSGGWRDRDLADNIERC